MEQNLKVRRNEGGRDCQKMIVDYFLQKKSPITVKVRPIIKAKTNT